jgi:hypothetical protein
VYDDIADEQRRRRQHEKEKRMLDGLRKLIAYDDIISSPDLRAFQNPAEVLYQQRPRPPIPRPPKVINPKKSR